MASSTPSRLPAAPQIAEQLMAVATLFYRNGMSQVDIARSLGLDPSTVSRYLKRARDEGIVHFEIRPPRSERIELGRELASRFRLRRAMVIADAEDPDDTLYGGGAEYISNAIQTGMRVGVSWGQTLAGVVRLLQPRAVSGLAITQLTGGLADAEPGNQGHELVRQLALLYPSSRVKYLHAPAIVDSPVIQKAILSDASVRSTLETAASSEVALVGIGSMGRDATLIRSGHLSTAELDRLRSEGAVGTLNSRFFDADGRAVGTLEERTIAITWEQLRAIPTVIAVAAGATKLTAIAGALRGGCVKVLITDAPTARALVSRAGPADP